MFFLFLFDIFFIIIEVVLLWLIFIMYCNLVGLNEIIFYNINKFVKECLFKIFYYMIDCFLVVMNKKKYNGMIILFRFIGKFLNICI